MEKNLLKNSTERKHTYLVWDILVKSTPLDLWSMECAYMCVCGGGWKAFLWNAFIWRKNGVWWKNKYFCSDLCSGIATGGQGGIVPPDSKKLPKIGKNGGKEGKIRKRGKISGKRGKIGKERQIGLATPLDLWTCNFFFQFLFVLFCFVCLFVCLYFV